MGQRRGDEDHRPGRVPSGSGGWFRDHPRLLDLLVVLAVFTYNLPILFGAVPERLWPGVGLLVSLGLCLPGLVRRQRPVASYLAIQAIAVLQSVLGISLIPADVMLLLAVYTIASRKRWQLSSGVAVVTTAWTVLSCLPMLARGDMSIGDVGVIVALLLWAWTWGRLVQTRRRYVASLQERAAQLEREKAVEAELAASGERTRIAREIHDVVSHSLSVVAVLSDGAAAAVEGNPQQAREAMLTVRDTGRTALADMRRMLGVLRDDEPGSHAPQPGIAQLPGLVAESRAAGLPVHLVEVGERRPVPASVDLTAYRIVQEALTNVRKHAGPGVREVRVTLTHSDEVITVDVSDDGAGPDPADGQHAGHGLIGMRERVAAHHGELSVGRRPAGGFEVVATIPTGDE
ncbi:MULTISPECIES: sensor histidine kinase [unclassified Luteococcus]|uniref:sensor histidine kinase n=1 Tax=unclassified Luteococcus TaxID=2639923 RepID=UPI00313E57BE